MRALSVWQAYASLIICGAKPYEYRKWPAFPGLVGERIVLHAAKLPMRPFTVESMLQEVEDEEAHEEWDRDRALELLRGVHLGGVILPMGCGIGTVTLGKPIRCPDLFPDDPFVADDMWAWPMLNPEPFAAPIPARGFQGFWTWPEFAKEGA